MAQEFVPGASVGLTKNGDDYVLQVNLAQSVEGLPAIVDGVSVIYKVVGRVTALS